MTRKKEDDLEPWLSVRKLALVEETTPRQIYWAIEHGLKHCRIGDRIRVRRYDWHQWHESHSLQRASVETSPCTKNERRPDQQATLTDVGDDVRGTAPTT